MGLKSHFIFFVFLCTVGMAVAQDPIGKIIIYREPNSADTSYIPPVFCDGKQLGRIIGGTYIEIFTTGGPHTCVTESLELQATSINVVPGQVVYLRVDIEAGSTMHAHMTRTTETDYSRQVDLISLVAPVHLNFPQAPGSSAPSTALPLDRWVKVGDLAIKVLSVDTGTARSADNPEDAVAIDVENRGSGAICASFSAHLETVSEQAYDTVAAPKALDTHELGPGKHFKETIEFHVASGEQPRMLLLQLRELPTGCGAEVRRLRADASTPTIIMFGLHHLLDSSPRDLPKSKPRPALAEGFTYPTCIRCPDPSYSESARKAKFRGSVEVQVLVSPNGATGDVQLIQSSGYADLDQKSIDTIRTWRFKPATGPNGSAISISLPVEITFRLL